MTLEEAYNHLRFRPPFYVRFKCDPKTERKIVKVEMFEHHIFLYEENDLQLTCHHLDVIEVGGKYISLFDRSNHEQNSQSTFSI